MVPFYEGLICSEQKNEVSCWRQVAKGSNSIAEENKIVKCIYYDVKLLEITAEKLCDDKAK